MKAGDYNRFVHGHWHNLQWQKNPSYGAQSRRHKQLEDLRKLFLMGKDVSQYFTTRAALSRFLNFTQSMGSFAIIMEAMQRTPRTPESYDEHIAKKSANERSRIHANAAQIFRFLAAGNAIVSG